MARLSGKHRATLEAIFTDPAPANIRWDDAVALLRALGAEVHQARGSRVLFVLDTARAVIHEPHPGNQLSRPVVRNFRAFLEAAGEVP